MIRVDILVNLRNWLAERGPKGVADWFAEGGLRIQEFTAMLGVDGDGTGLKAALIAQDKADPSPYAGVRWLHNLRWILFSPGAKNPDATPTETGTRAAPAGAAAEKKALILSFVFEGDADDALRALLEHAPVEPILRHCVGFRADDDAAAYLMKHRVRGGYMFRDLGPLFPSDRYTPDATRVEIEDARALEQAFETFYDEYSSASPELLHEKFVKEFGDDGFEFALTSLERRLPDEARWVRRTSELIRRLQEQAARQDPAKVKRRGVHAKAHGLIKASFVISGPEALPAKYRVGIFARPGMCFDAHLRPSNGAHTVGSDRAPDARGLAISVDIPLGEHSDQSAADFLRRPAERTTGRQDFVLMSHPTFFAPDIRRLAVLMSILAAKPLGTKLGRALAFACGSGSLRQLGIAIRTFMGRVVHPLAVDFHSTTPYLLGDRYIVKYSVELDDRRRLEQLKREQVQNFLSDALRESLKDRPIELGFYLHALSTSVVPGKGRSIRDVVEDATLDWKALGAEKTRVATIRIGPQDPTTFAQLLRAEEWEFNPWYALDVHRPLGSLNRARLSIYPASQTLRRNRGSDVPQSGARSNPPRGLSEAAE